MSGEVREQADSVVRLSEFRPGVDPPCGGTFDVHSGCCDKCCAVDPSKAGTVHTYPGASRG